MRVIVLSYHVYKQKLKIFMLKSTPMTSKNKSSSSIFELNQDTREIHQWHKFEPNATNIYLQAKIANFHVETDPHDLEI